MGEGWEDLYQRCISTNDPKIGSIELTKFGLNNNPGAFHILPSLIPRELPVTKDYLGPSLRSFQSLVTSPSRRIFKPVTGTVPVYLGPLFILNGFPNAVISKLLMPGLDTTQELQYLILFTIRSRNRWI